MESHTPWPLIVRAGYMKTLPPGTQATVEVGLHDAMGQMHALALSSAAALTLCVLLSNHMETELALAEIPNRPFRIDDFAPAVEVEIKPEAHADQREFAATLSALALRHPNFWFAIDASAGSARLSGIDELQLGQLIEATRQLHGIRITVGNAQAAYRERITERTEVDYSHKTQSGGIGEFARVKLVLEPTPKEYGCPFAAIGAGSKLSGEFIAAVERGVRSATGSGVLNGFPVIGMRALLVDGAAHESDSTPAAFKAAASAAIKRGLQQGKPQVVEPVLRVEIRTPEKYVGAIIADLRARNGATDGRGRRSRSGITITALVSAANFFGYADALATMTETCGAFSAQFDRYVPIPMSQDSSFRPAVALRA
jgi:elongation factor G